MFKSEFMHENNILPIELNTHYLVEIRDIYFSTIPV